MRTKATAVSIHGVLENLETPLKALVEVRRALRSGGVIGARSTDWGGFLLGPSNAILEKAVALWQKLQRHKGINTQFGRHRAGVIRQAKLIPR